MNFRNCLLIWVLVVSLFVWPNALPYSNAADFATAQTTQSQTPPQLEQSLKSAIESVYGKDQTEAIYQHVIQLSNQGKRERSPSLIQADIALKPDWYKDEIIYMLYADRFGIKNGEKTATFDDLVDMLDYLQDLGVTTIYILPFMDSPMGDAGFDVRNPKEVRTDLGGTEAFERFVAQAKQQGFKIKSDLILNHFSDQHHWFQEALNGDLEKLNYFIVTDKMPPFKKYVNPARGVVVDYTEDDGTISSRQLIFPGICENHYRKVTIQGKDYYVYHTFYPFQLDTNWENPKVLYEVLDIMNTWANRGVDIFRLDAIPYYIKQKGTTAENLPKTHAVIQLLSTYLQLTAPHTVMQAEANEHPKDLLGYFGHEQHYVLPIHTPQGEKLKPMTRTDEVQIAYNFLSMPAIWASLKTYQKDHFWKAVYESPKLPESAAWGNFLRVHDELTLGMLDVNTRKKVYDSLIPHGAEFPKDLGVGGRMADFLNRDPRQIHLAFSILLSLPGIPILYYGDEIGETNDFAFARQYAKQREETLKKTNPDMDVISYYDSRDINRNVISSEKLYAAQNSPKSYSGRIYQSVKTLNRIRRSHPVLTRGTLQEIATNQPTVLSYKRTLGKAQLYSVNNLSDKPVDTVLNVSPPQKRSTLLDLQTHRNVPFQRIGCCSLKLHLTPFQSDWLSPQPVNKS
jgi:maltose alpha-D-glucosyltransferase / alpha-amylase